MRVAQSIEFVLKKRLSEKAPLIQIILGPRQVGKTTSVLSFIEKSGPHHFLYVNGDGVSSPHWISEQWQKATENNQTLIIDEIQKIPEWSETIKKHWDLSLQKKKRIKCVLLGSSSLSLQKGLSESLTGRFELIPAYHWDFETSCKLKKFSLKEYLTFGGYPGSYAYIKDVQRWKDYVQSSIVETVITRDILAQAKVKAPALFRQCFYIINNFPAQVVSYNKILGQLQDRGNIDLVKYYLDLFESAYLIRTIPKFSQNEVRKKQSSPKIISLAPALNTFHRMDKLSSEYMGHVFESLVGAQLLKTQKNISYWAEGDYEVDFVLEHKNTLIAIEVKSDRAKKAKSLDKFLFKNPKAVSIFITSENYADFEKKPLQFLEKFI